MSDSPVSSVAPFDLSEFEKTNKPLLEASNLSPRLYNDPEIFALEMDTAFHSHWFCIGRVEDFPEGESVSFRIGALLLSVTRTGAQLTAENASVDTWQGFVFACREEKGPLAAQLTETNAVNLDQYSLSENRSIRQFEWDVEANWKLLVDNFVEEYHVAYVHAKSFNPVMPMEEWKPQPDLTTQPWSWMFGIFPDVSFGDAEPRFPTIPTLGPELKQGMGILTVFPNLMVILAVDCLVYYYVLPVDAGHSKVVAHLCLLNDIADGVEKGDPGLVDGAAEYIRNVQMILDEDLEASDQQAVGLRSRLAVSGRYSKREALLSTFHRWVIEELYLPAKAT
jgi:phenylpropionate dioxygenase-like ring-hydroxylating dioxygenase large terminal subunit